MAGHSQFANIMHRKGAQDKKRAKVFAKHIREITTAARMGGGDPASNPRLRAAIIAAKGVNMPADNIDRAVKKGSGELSGESYEQMRYEGYGPGGVAIIVETLTDNKTRTAAEVRSAFSKYGGNLGETNSVSFMFEQLGEVIYPLETASAEAMFEAAVEAGAQDAVAEADVHIITTVTDDLAQVASFLEDKYGEPKSAKFTWRATTDAPIDGKQAETFLKLMDTLEDNDDVQQVYSNVQISEEDLANLS